MRRRRVAPACIAALAATLAGLSAGSIAQATTTIRYCSQTVAPYTKCPDSPNRHTYDTNTVNAVQGRANAWESKCEKMTWWSDENDIFSRRCRAGSLSVSGSWSDRSFTCCEPNDRHLLKVYVGNDFFDYMYIYGVGAY